MSDRLPWFRCFPSALLGALAGLDPDEGLVYVTTLLRIYETGSPVAETARTLSRRTGLTERRAAAALERLLLAAKLTLTGDGKLDSASTHAEIGWQRERHQDQASAGRASAAKRQQQSVGKKNASSVISDDVNDSQKAQRNQQNGSTAVERPFNHLEEDTDQKEDEPLSDAGTKSDFSPNAFGLWWQAQPNKVGKDAAEKAFAKIRKSGRVTFAELMDGLARYKATKPPTREWCHPTTWLNQGRWADEPADPVPRPAPSGRPASAQQRALELAFNAHRDLMGDPDDPGPFADDAAARPADGRYANGHDRAGFHEPAGRGFGLSAPRLAGPPRPH